MNGEPDLAVQAQQAFERIKTRLTFRNRRVPPTFLLTKGFRVATLNNLAIKEEAIDWRTGRLLETYMKGKGLYNVEKMIKDKDSIVDEAYQFDWLEIPVVTLRCEKYVEHLDSFPVLIDDVSFDLLVILITACHEIDRFPLGPSTKAFIPADELYVGLLYIYLSLYLTTQSDVGEASASALYHRYRRLFETIAHYGTTLLRCAKQSPSAEIVRKGLSRWILNHERAHLLLAISPTLRNKRWAKVQETISAIAEQKTSSFHEALCQFQRMQPFVSGLSPQSATAEEIICDYFTWEMEIQFQLDVDESLPNISRMLVAGQNAINAISRIGEMQHLVAPFVLNDMGVPFEKMRRWDLENLSRRWICYEAMSNVAVGYYAGRELGPTPTVEQVAEFVGRSGFLQEVVGKLGPHFKSRHKMWTKTMDALLAPNIREAILRSHLGQTSAISRAFSRFLSRWNDLCGSAWSDMRAESREGGQ
jgi:hypothetical protein